VDGKERLKFAFDRIEHIDSFKCEMQRLARHRLETVSKICLTIKKHRSLVHREILSA
jgi:hypothetical protein